MYRLGKSKEMAKTNITFFLMTRECIWALEHSYGQRQIQKWNTDGTFNILIKIDPVLYHDEIFYFWRYFIMLITLINKALFT